MISRRFPAVLSLLSILVAARTSNADKPEPPGAGAVDEQEAARTEEPQEKGAQRTASAGAFLPFTIGASSDATYGTAQSGYDGARRAFIYEGVADAHVVGGLSVRAGYSSHDLWGRGSAMLGGRYQFLSQKRHGLDLGAALLYLPQNIEGEGLVKASLLLGRNVGKVALFSSMSYGQDPEGDDHQAELTIGSVLRLGPAVLVGVDARARMLVFSSDTKHGGIAVPMFDMAAGPLAHYVRGPIALTTQVGLSALATEGVPGSIQPTAQMRYGVFGLVSAGFSL
ncbi:MAG TPA: hypothetical protein VF881_05330 [Polyangiaceae bacterium]